jgi:hypothetical protein
MRFLKELEPCSVQLFAGARSIDPAFPHVTVLINAVFVSSVNTNFLTVIINGNPRIRVVVRIAGLSHNVLS